MKEKFYTSERSILILISLLKQFNIKKIVASPGATNITFIGSLMHDSYFEIYSSVDERSAAYIACGLAAESNEPVVISCTGATASRNYLPGLTEAYYRKLPILAVTSTQDERRIGHMHPQVIDRSSIQNDVAVLSEHIPATLSEMDEWSNTIKINRALHALRYRGGGPVHINMATEYSRDYSVKDLPAAKKIDRIMYFNQFPEIPKGRIAIYIGNHRPMTEKEIETIDKFCGKYDAVVFCDHTSGYRGKYRVLASLLASQLHNIPKSMKLGIELLIHIGEVNGSYMNVTSKYTWRVNPDGELRDYFKNLSCVFEMEPFVFFSHYGQSTEDIIRDTYLNEALIELNSVREKIGELPFSNTWIASQTAHRLPEGCVLHLGILNTLRNWNMFEIPETVTSFSNTGGFGIDGVLSTAVGASLSNPSKLVYCVIGDLAYFYDLNVTGNRHIGKNIRILIINNGKGTEFRNYMHPGSDFGDEADKFIAAGGHYGNKSPELIKHFSEDLGYEYLTASTKEEYLKNVERFVIPKLTARPIIFEVFTSEKDESDALLNIAYILSSKIGKAKSIVAKALPESAKNAIKKALK